MFPSVLGMEHSENFFLIIGCTRIFIGQESERFMGIVKKVIVLILDKGSINIGR